MGKRDDARRRTPSKHKQFQKFASAVTSCIPVDLDSGVMQCWIDNPAGLAHALRQALCPPDKTEKSLDSTHLINLDANPIAPSNCSWHAEDQLPGRLRGEIRLERRGNDLCADGRKMDLFLADKQKTRVIAGRDLKEILRNQPVLDSSALDFLLKPENQHLIPDSWKGKYVFFWGDIFRDSDGHLCVRYLYWGSDRWSWNYYRLDYDWNSFYPALACAE